METKKLSLAKKCVAFFIGLVLILSATITPMAASPVGDLNGDNTVSAPDLATLATVIITGDKDLSYDVNGDGVINILDLVRLKKMLAYVTTKVTVPVTPIDGKVPEGGLTLAGGGVSAFVPEGVLLEDDVKELTLTVIPLTSTGVAVGENENITSYDVHISGISKKNTVPVIIDLGAVMPKFLNMGNYKIYHVENGENVLMTLVDSKKELTAHNQFTYEPETGKVTVAMATFSEIALVSDTENAWNGEYDYSWYTTNLRLTDADYTIINADQLAAFGRIVGGMAEGIERDSFEGKTIKLVSDINLGDDEINNDPDKIFYPIGYYNNQAKFDRENAVGITGVESTVKSFQGIFDGNGHVISNFYQNTWEMFGDYNNGYSGTPNYYKDAMGLFGYVVNGTVKNLTIDNFSSDGEFTPTGVIAAYAVNSTFENIALTNCNPRVYNTGNGGIVGVGGNSDDTEDLKLTFSNITIDNTNKITALWGSWDVACGGLVGMFRGAGHAYMTNCHVGAQIDVFNDVCGNYQYYWYRYAGMMIGTNYNMVTVDGRTLPDTSKYHAEGCTVHFGDWNDYYYCELVANSLASYTHDHQFSRLTIISSLDEIKSGETWTKAGNFLLIDGDTKTCYHIVNKDGVLTQHFHEDAGYDVGIDENKDGHDDLKEDKQIVYLPFNQLFTGYGWGVNHIPVYNGEDYAFDGITILDRTVADSVVKFAKGDNVAKQYYSSATVKIGNLFKAADIDDDKLSINSKLVKVFVSPASDTSTAGGKYTANINDWTQSTLTFTGTGKAAITITDYYFCKTTTIETFIMNDFSYDGFDEGVNKYQPTATLGLREIIEEPNNTTNKILRVVGGPANAEGNYAGGNYYRTVVVERNTDYTWIFRMKSLNHQEDVGATRITVHPENAWNNLITSITDFNDRTFSQLNESGAFAEVRTIDDNWQTFVVKFNSGENAKVRLWHNMMADGREIYMDDWSLYMQPALGEFENGGFESGLGNWNTTAQLTAEVVTDNINSGEKALKVGATSDAYHDAYLYKEVTVKPNTDYIWSYWYKCQEGETEQHHVLSGVLTDDCANLLPSTISSNGGFIVSNLASFPSLRPSNQPLNWHQGMTTPTWQKYEVKFNSGDNTSVYLTFNMVTAARIGWTDDWSLTELSE